MAGSSWQIVNHDELAKDANQGIDPISHLLFECSAPANLLNVVYTWCQIISDPTMLYNMLRWLVKRKVGRRPKLSSSLGSYL